MSAQRPDRRDGEVQNIFHITIILVRALSFTCYDPQLIQFYAYLSSIESPNKRVMDSRINRINNKTGTVAWPRRSRNFSGRVSGLPRRRDLCLGVRVSC